MAKHSPGPWRWEGGQIVDDLGSVVVMAPIGSAECTPYPRDARLIAAAPEMFDVLERLLAEDALSSGDAAEVAILLAGIEHGSEREPDAGPGESR